MFFLTLQCKSLELKLEEERVFTEYEQVPKKRPDGLVTTAALPDNTERNRFRDVVPYEENRVELVPNKENNTGYINASHIKVGRAALVSGVRPAVRSAGAEGEPTESTFFAFYSSL